MPDYLLTREVMKLCGVTARQLQWWDETGIIQPLFQNVIGSGLVRTYGRMEILRIMALDRLKATRVSVRLLKAVINGIRFESAPYACVTFTRHASRSALDTGSMKLFSDEVALTAHLCVARRVAFVLDLGSMKLKIQKALK